MGLRRSASASALFLGSFALYLVCAYPSIAPRDSADLAVAALGLGVAHPPGYPLYALAGKAWLSLFPWGNPAYRLNILSSLCGAGAVACLFLFLRRRMHLAAALGAALAMGFGAFFWKFCLLEEMYSFQALFLTVLLLLSDGEQKSFVWRLSLSGLLYGLGLANHQSLILFSPALFWLWRTEAKSLRRDVFLDLLRFCVFCGLGLSVEVFLWIRLDDLGVAWDVLRRAPYGTLTLFKPYSAPLAPAAVWSLLAYLVSGLCKNALPAAFLALVGALSAWRQERRWFWALALGFAFFGPVYFLATRFDTSLWTVRGVLAPDFIAPGLFLCVLSAYGVEALRHRAPMAAWPAALALAAWPLATNAASSCRRNDFSAYDYAKDLGRELPPQSAAVIEGDSAFFGLRYLEMTNPHFGGRTLIDAADSGVPSLIKRETTRRLVYVTGLPEIRLVALGLLGNPLTLRPEGLFQRVMADDATPVHSGGTAWIFSAQRFAAGEPDDFNVHDIRLCYGYAHYLSARLLERSSLDSAAAREYEAAFAADPDDYKISLGPDKNL